MFNKFTSALKISSNLTKIKDTVHTVSGVINKTITAVDFVGKQSNNTKYGKMIAQYIPAISGILAKIRAIIDKYAPMIGVDTSNVSAQSVTDENEVKTILDSAVSDLDKLLK